VAKRNRSEVDDYIAECPKEMQGDLAKIRAAIRAAVPRAMERTDYFQMPGYSYPGLTFYDGMFAWFSFKKPHVRLQWPSCATLNTPALACLFLASNPLTACQRRET
jgi:uncharacterized protein YdhG (YjbR/CyaY superfamily)